MWVFFSVCADLIRGAKEKNLKVKGPVRMPTKVLKTLFSCLKSLFFSANVYLKHLFFKKKKVEMKSSTTKLRLTQRKQIMTSQVALTLGATV